MKCRYCGEEYSMTVLPVHEKRCTGKGTLNKGLKGKTVKELLTVAKTHNLKVPRKIKKINLLEMLEEKIWGTLDE